MTNPFSDPSLATPASGSPCASDRVLDLLLAGALDAARGGALREHLSACSTCSARFGELRAFRDELAPRLPAFSELVAKQPRRLPRARRLGGWVGGGLAAAACLAFWLRHGPAEDPRFAETR
ncbi:MAG TPA: hypothetical protein VJU61_22690, partial [Polyangiaceae bacterium]|nr:hypothetical protein [Polyangiaceae bacterium]